jgi:hypothetical protein
VHHPGGEVQSAQNHGVEFARKFRAETTEQKLKAALDFADDL